MLDVRRVRLRCAAYWKLAGISGTTGLVADQMLPYAAVGRDAGVMPMRRRLPPK